jgi:hypothetical protein
VKANLPDKTFDRLCRVSMPWVCLLCGSSDTAPERAAEGVRRLFLLAADVPELGAIAPAPSIETLVRGVPPDYFDPLQEVLRTEAPRPRIEMLRRLSAQNPEIDGIVLITDASSEEAT